MRVRAAVGKQIGENIANCSDGSKMVKEAFRSPSSAPRDVKGVGRSIDIWAVQCAKCMKWRKVAGQDAFEEIRSQFKEMPYYCDRNPNISCDDPGDIEYDSTRTWAVDKPNLPKTPAGFTRRLVMRSDFSKIDVYYQAPTGKTLRSTTEVASYLEKNPQVMDVKVSHFSFTSPKVVDDKTSLGSIAAKRKAVTGVVE